MATAGARRAAVALNLRSTTAATGRAAAASPPPRAVPGFAVVVEYRGSGAPTLVGPVTGRRYFFPGTGARTVVDVRDRDVLRLVRGFRIVEE